MIPLQIGSLSMAQTTAEFIPELWSQALVDKLKIEMQMNGGTHRTKGDQLLRDAALGHPEYPEYFTKTMTATEVQLREQYAHQAAEQMAKNLDRSILATFADRYGGGRGS